MGEVLIRKIILQPFIVRWINPQYDFQEFYSEFVFVAYNENQRVRFRWIDRLMLTLTEQTAPHAMTLACCYITQHHLGLEDVDGK